MIAALQVAHDPVRILIVDDERKNRRLLEIMLAPEGFVILTASSGEEALAIVAEQRPDLILLDVMMPGMDGYQVAAKIKENPATRNILVIMVTALKDRSATVLGLTAGAEDFISKPVDRGELCVRIRNLLRLKTYGDQHLKYSQILEGEVGSRTADLVASERLYRSTFDAAPVGIAHVSLDGTWLLVNQRLCDLLGYSSTELQDPSVQKLVQLEEAAGEAEERLQIVAGTLDRMVDEKRYRRRDGNIVWTRVNVSLHRDAGGKPDHFIWVLEDITKRRTLEAQVRQSNEDLIRSEERMRLLVENVQDYAILMLDSRGHVLSWNSGAERLTGYTAEEVVGESVSVFYPPGDVQRDKPQQALDTAITQGRAEDEGWRVRKDCSRFWADVVITPLRDAGWELLGFSMITRDLTGRRRAEQELRSAEAKFRGLLESAPDAIVIINSEQHIVLINAETEKLFGYHRDELLHKPVGVLVPERHRHAQAERHSGYFAHSEPRPTRLRRDLVALHKDGTEFPVEVSVSPLETDEGIILSIAIRDVSSRVQAAAALKQANRELEAFSYSVAHDLRAPLRGMNGFAHILLDTYKDKLDAEGQDWLKEILVNASRMGALIDALLLLSRITRVDLNRVQIDLAEIARGLASELATAEPDRAVDVVVQADLCANADPNLARSLIANLLGNAWKFTSRTTSARIEVGATMQNGSRVFFVRDNGAGFDMAFADKLFAPFQRLHTVSDFPGTGIGLATAQRIVQRHGGQISTEGSVDGGATFYFTLPGNVSKTEGP